VRLKPSVLLLVIALLTTFARGAAPAKPAKPSTPPKASPPANAGPAAPVRELQFPKGEIRSLCFSPDGKLLVAGTYEHGYVFDVAGGKLVSECLGNGGFCFDPAGQFVLTTYGPGVQHFDLKTQKVAGAVPLRVEGTYQRQMVAMSGDRKRVAIRLRPASADAGKDQIQVWDTATGKPAMAAAIPLTPAQFAHSISMSNDGKILVVGLEQNTQDAKDTLAVMVIDTSSGKTLWTLAREPSGQPRRAAVSPDGKSIAVAVSDQPIEFHDVEPHRPGRKVALKTGPLDHSVRAAEYSADGKWLAVATTEGPAMIEVASGKVIGPFGFSIDRYKDRVEVQEVAISPDGTMLAAGSPKVVRLWDVSGIARGR